ncbi:MAG: hypothetical protein QXI16_03240 [Sulfolobaceae archaeon]
MKFKKDKSEKESNHKESNSIPQQNRIKESNKEPFIPKEAITSKHIEEMIRNQKRLEDPYQIERTIPLLKNVLPKLLIPYLSDFSILDRPSEIFIPILYSKPNFHMVMRPGGDVTNVYVRLSHSHKSLDLSSPTEIDILGNEIAFRLNRDHIQALIFDGIDNSPINISLDQLSNELENIMNEVDLDVRLHLHPNGSKNVVVICNDLDEAILQSTKRYQRIKVPGFEDKPFKIGRLLDKYIVYVTPVMNKGKLVIFETDFSVFYKLYQIELPFKNEYEAIVKLFGRYTSDYRPKLINLE